MKKERRKNGKRLRFFPLVLGIYAGFLSSGLMAAATTNFMEGATTIAALRLACGIGLACLGLYGIGDGIRDLFRTNSPKPEPPRQYILTDVHGQRSSNVTGELLRAQLQALSENENAGSFSLTALPPVSVPGLGELRQITIIYEDSLKLAAFFLGPDGSHVIRQKSAQPDTAADILREFLAGSLDFSDWEKSDITVHSEKPESTPQQRLSILGESWRNDLKFFSARDVELAIDGLADGKYQKIELALGAAVFFITPSPRDESVMLVHLLIWEGVHPHAFQKTGTATQVKFWLVQIFSGGQPVELHGWMDITNDTIK